MSEQTKIIYNGDLKTTVIYNNTDTQLQTMAGPVQGTRSNFSPTDLLAASLGTCTVSMIGFLAQREGLNVEGLTMTVEKGADSCPVRQALHPDIKVKKIFHYPA